MSNKMWAVCVQIGRNKKWWAVPGTNSYSRKDAIYAFMRGVDGLWFGYYRRGYRCKRIKYEVVE